MAELTNYNKQSERGGGDGDGVEEEEEEREVRRGEASPVISSRSEARGRKMSES